MGCVPARGGAEPSRGLVVGSGQRVPSVRDKWPRAVLQELGTCVGTLVGMWNSGILVKTHDSHENFQFENVELIQMV